MQTSFLSAEELAAMGFKSVGSNVQISRKASIYRPQAIALGSHVRIDDFCVLSGGEGINVGSYIHIACYCALFGSAGIVLEDFAGLSARVTIYSESDDYTGRSLTNPTVPPQYKTAMKRGRVVLRRHVIVGAHTVILPGVELHEGAAVGSQSLVTKDCDAWSIYFGSPAKRLRSRSQQMLELEQKLREGEPPI